MSSGRRTYATPAASPSTWRTANPSSTPLRRAPLRTSVVGRHGRSATSPSSRIRQKPRPAWNEYLTDDAQYKLSRERQLVRHMQQLSAAHFHARASPRRRPLPGDTSEDGDEQASGPEDFSDRHSEATSQRSLETNSSDVSMRYRTPGSKQRLQDELSTLEHMLSDLELESERLGDHAHDNGHTKEDGAHEESRSVGYDDDRDDDDVSARDDPQFEDPVAQICYKSLRVGIDLTQKMHLLTHKLEAERRHRKKQDERIRKLEQLYLATQERSDQIEVRYHDLTSQVDAMRDAMIATEEALHRVSQDLMRAREPITFTTHFGDATRNDHAPRDPGMEANSLAFVRSDQ